MIRHNIYYQKQIGGNCRLHALNGYFGSEKISMIQWGKYMKEYDEWCKKYYNTNTSCQQFDLINSGGQTIISWILMQHGVYSRYIAMGCDITLLENLQTMQLAQNTWFFMFNESHIWGVRYYVPHKKWFKVDSISGISSFDINSLSRCKEGLIIPTLPQPEFVRLGNLISCEIGHNDICQYIKHLLERGDILGDLEVWIASAMGCLDAQLHTLSEPHEFAKIQIFVDKWYEFLSIWTNGNYTNLPIIEKYIPYFITNIIKII